MVRVPEVLMPEPAAVQTEHLVRCNTETKGHFTTIKNISNHGVCLSFFLGGLESVGHSIAYGPFCVFERCLDSNPEKWRRRIFQRYLVVSVRHTVSQKVHSLSSYTIPLSLLHCVTPTPPIKRTVNRDGLMCVSQLWKGQMWGGGGGGWGG
jgi:hypothetical protein